MAKDENDKNLDIRKKDENHAIESMIDSEFEELKDEVEDFTDGVDSILEDREIDNGRGRTHSIDTEDGKIYFSLGISGYGDRESGTGGEAYTSVDVSNELLESMMSGDSFAILDDRTVENSGSVKVSGLSSEGVNNSEIIFPSGVIGIYGKTASGKSVLTGILQDALNGKFIRFHEPEIPSILRTDDFFDEVISFLKSSDRVLLVDSLRFFIYNVLGKRAAGKGGISSAFFSDLTALSVLCSYLGKTIFVVINPMVDDEKDINRISHSLEGSLAGLITTRQYGSFSYVARTKLNNRSSITYSYLDNDGNIISSSEVMASEDRNGNEASVSIAAMTQPKAGGSLEIARWWNNLKSVDK